MGRSGLFVMIVIILLSIGGWAMFRDTVKSNGEGAPAAPATTEQPANSGG